MGSRKKILASSEMCMKCVFSLALSQFVFGKRIQKRVLKRTPEASWLLCSFMTKELAHGLRCQQMQLPPGCPRRLQADDPCRLLLFTEGVVFGASTHPHAKLLIPHSPRLFCGSLGTVHGAAWKRKPAGHIVPKQGAGQNNNIGPTLT